LAPVNLHLAALVAGVDVPPLRPGSVVWELGCGYGNTVISAAVAYPECRFVGVDYNSAHIAGGNQRIDTLGLRNVELMEADIVDLAARPGSLPPCDLAILHGLYSWVGEPVRVAVREMLGWGVRPGGLVYISYNSLPGAGAMSVVQRTLIELSKLSVGRSDVRARDAIARMDALKAAGAKHLSGTADIDRQVQRVKDLDGGELCHEYLNEGWGALFHSQVADDMETARLEYVGNAIPHQNFLASLLTPAQMKAVEDIHLSSARETAVDLFINRILRRDLYVRGVQHVKDDKRAYRLRDISFCARCCPDDIDLTLLLPVGSVALPDAYARAGEMLWREGPLPLGVLLDGPLAPIKPVPNETAALLVACGIAWPCRPDRAPETMAAVRRAVLDLATEVRALGLQHQGMIPAPSVGTEVLASGLEARVLEGLWGGVQEETAALVEHVWAPFEASGERLVYRGQRTEDAAQCRALLADAVEAIRGARVPLWRGLGMLPPPE